MNGDKEFWLDYSIFCSLILSKQDAISNDHKKAYLNSLGRTIEWDRDHVIVYFTDVYDVKKIESLNLIG